MTAVSDATATGGRPALSSPMGAPGDAERYQCRDYDWYYAGDEFNPFHAPHTAAARALPAIAEQLLRQCDRFRTLDEHAQLSCRSDAFRDVPIDHLRDLLSELVGAELLALLGAVDRIVQRDDATGLAPVMLLSRPSNIVEQSP